MTDDHSQAAAEDTTITHLQSAVADFRRRRLDIDQTFTANPHTITEALAIWLGQEHGYAVAIANCKPLPDTHMRARWPIPPHQIVMATANNGSLYGVDATWHQLYAYDEEGLRDDALVPEDMPEDPAVWPLSPRAHDTAISPFGDHPALGSDLFEIVSHDTIQGATAAVAAHLEEVADAFREWLTPLTGVVPPPALLRRAEPLCWDLRAALENAATDPAVAEHETCRASLEAADGHLVDAAGCLMTGLVPEAESELAQAVTSITRARAAYGAR